MTPEDASQRAIEDIRAKHGVMMDAARASMEDGLAVYHLHLYWPGLWHMHGTGQPYSFPFSSQRDCMTRAETLARQLGAKRMVAHVHNESPKWKQEPVTNPKTGRLYMAKTY